MGGIPYPTRPYARSTSAYAMHASSHHLHDTRSASDRETADPAPPRKRIAVACGRCRKRKIRCSGDPGNGQPCQSCKQASAEPCLFLRVSSTEATIRADDAGFAYNIHAARQQSVSKSGLPPVVSSGAPTPAVMHTTYPDMSSHGSSYAQHAPSPAPAHAHPHYPHAHAHAHANTPAPPADFAAYRSSTYAPTTTYAAATPAPTHAQPHSQPHTPSGSWVHPYDEAAAAATGPVNCGQLAAYPYSHAQHMMSSPYRMDVKPAAHAHHTSSMYVDVDAGYTYGNSPASIQRMSMPPPPPPPSSSSPSSSSSSSSSTQAGHAYQQYSSPIVSSASIIALDSDDRAASSQRQGSVYRGQEQDHGQAHGMTYQMPVSVKMTPGSSAPSIADLSAPSPYATGYQPSYASTQSSYASAYDMPAASSTAAYTTSSSVTAPASTPPMHMSSAGAGDTVSPRSDSSISSAPSSSSASVSDAYTTSSTSAESLYAPEISILHSTSNNSQLSYHYTGRSDASPSSAAATSLMGISMACHSGPGTGAGESSPGGSSTSESRSGSSSSSGHVYSPPVSEHNIPGLHGHGHPPFASGSSTTGMHGPSLNGATPGVIIKTEGENLRV